MERDEALKVLGLEPSAGKEEIEAAFLERVKAVHPDAGGTDDAFRTIAQARDIAIASLKQGSDLVPLAAVRDLLSIIREERREEAEQRAASAKEEAAKAESRRVTTNIVVSNMAKHSKMSRTASLLAALSVGYAGLTVTGHVPEFPGSTWIFLLVGAVIGAWAWAARQAAHDLEIGVNYFSERLSDRAYYQNQILGMVAYQSRRAGTQSDVLDGFNEWLTDNELQYEGWLEEEQRPNRIATGFTNLLRKMGLIRTWYRLTWRIRKAFRYVFGSPPQEPHQIAGLIGYSDFRRLMVAKGIEHGLVEAREILPNYEGGRPHIIYVLTHPSYSKPEKD